MSSTGLQAPGDVRWTILILGDARNNYHQAHAEVLADLRRDTQEVANYLATFGADALADLPAEEITADWRQQNVLVCCHINAQSEILDLTDPTVRHQMEQRHATLLAAHGMKHLDVTEVALRRRSMDA